MKKRVVIVGNGTLNKSFLKKLKSGDYIIGVDRAAYWLIRQGRVPDVAIGDFDSCTEKEWGLINNTVKIIKKFTPEKDETDMELAVRLSMTMKPAEVLIFGGIGSRMDHTIGTLQVIDALLSAKIPHVIVDETNRMRLIGKGRTILKSGGEYTYVSVLPFTNTICLALSGFRYDVPKTTLIRGATRGISNHIVGGQAEIILYSGKAWIIESND